MKCEKDIIIGESARILLEELEEWYGIETTVIYFEPYTQRTILRVYLLHKDVDYNDIIL